MNDIPIPTRLKNHRIVALHDVAVPYYLWRPDIDVLHDRKVRLGEETVLRLVDAGVNKPDLIAQLMGMDDVRMVSNLIVDLLRRTLLGNNYGLYVTPAGKTVLAQEAVREPTKLGSVRIWHDPYRDVLLSGMDERTLTERDAKRLGYRLLPTSGTLESGQFEARIKDVQEILINNRSEYERQYNKTLGGQLDVLNLRTGRPELVYKPARLAVLYNASAKSMEWMLVRGHGENTVEETTVVERLHELELEGYEIVPTLREEDLLRADDTPITREIDAAIAELQEDTDTTSFLSTMEHRGELIQAVMRAREELVIISPWMNRGAVDNELRQAFEEALRKHKSLHIRIGFGIARSDRRPEQEAQDAEKSQKFLMDRLAKFGERFSMVDLGNTHQKIVICDDKLAIVTSFNFLSFNPKFDPRKGYVREETGTKFTRKTSVAKLRAKLTPIYSRILGELPVKA
jgi:hypothetical protein